MTAQNGWSRRNLLVAMAGGGLLAAGRPDRGLAEAGPDGIADEELARKLGLDIPPERLAEARRFLARHPAIDVHSHPGRFFMSGVDLWHPSLQMFAAQDGAPQISVADMQAGGLAAACFAVVTDMKSLVLTETGLHALRPLAPGESWDDCRRQLAEFRRLLASEPIRLALTARDVIDNHQRGQLSGILTAEGGDFLEGRLERLPQVWSEGMRSITIVHYRVNEIGDIQTETPVHGGLSAFGADLVREMNALGFIIDLAHASHEVVRQAAAITTRPLLLSHSHLQHEPAAHTRLITVEQARLIAGTGGTIGAWPAGLTQRNLGDFIDETLRLIDAVGIDHVSVGSDMDANYRPVFDNYRQLPLVVAMLGMRGLDEDALAKVIGGNFLRVFAAAQVEAES